MIFACQHDRSRTIRIRDIKNELWRWNFLSFINFQIICVVWHFHVMIEGKWFKSRWEKVLMSIETELMYKGPIFLK